MTHPFDTAAEELASVGTSALNLAPSIDLVFTVKDSEHAQNEKLLHTEMVTGDYNKTTLTLTSAPILPTDHPWGGGVHTAVCQVWGALEEAIENFETARALIEPVVPGEIGGDV